MKTYTFWVTMEGKGPMKVAEDGRTASEAKQIVEARFPGARIVFAEGFQMKKTFACTVCGTKFVHKKPETLVGKLGIIPVNLCKKHFKAVMKHDELLLNDHRKVAQDRLTHW